MSKKRSIFYKNAWFYISILKIIHGKNFTARYRHICCQIGKNVSVLEPGAGPGIIPSFLDKSCKYYGFDQNPDFVKSAQHRGLDIQLGNMLDKKAFRRSDVAVLVDVIHHLKPANQQILLKNTLSADPKIIIICEPYMHTFSLISKMPLFSKLHKRFFDFIEQDGNNEARIEHIHSKDGLMQTMQNGFGIIPVKAKKEIKEIGDDLVVTYVLNK